MSDPGPRQEVEKAKLSGNRRGVGWVHSTGETLEQSREERWRRGRREGTQSEEEVDAEARPGHSAGYGVSQEAPIHGSNLNGPSQAPKIDHVRPPTRARCGQAARRDLWGRCRLPGTSTRHDKGLYLAAKIVDDEAWEKVVQGVYKGFSIGGRVTARDPADR